MNKTKPQAPSLCYPADISEYIKTIYDPNPANFHYYQHLVIEYFTKSKLSRKGIIINHQMGYGKSREGIAIADALSTIGPVIFITKKNLKINMKNEIEKYIKEFPESAYLRDTANWGTMGNSLKKSLLDFIKIKKLKGLNNTTVIVDEAHLLARMIANGSEIGVMFYDMVMASPECRIVFLTGTLMMKMPFQLVPLINMCAGNPPVLPEDQALFNSFFIDKDKHLINKHIFQNRIYGLVSFAGYKKNTIDPHYPQLGNIDIVKLPMLANQYNIYQSVEKKEEFEIANMEVNKKIASGFTKFGSDKKSGTYRVRSRQISNFLPPDWLLDKIGILTTTELSHSERNAYLAELKPEELESPKNLWLLKFLETQDGCGNLFCEFTGLFGIECIARFLETHGYIEYFPDIKTEKPIFAKITGETPIESVEKIRLAANSGEIKLLMFGKTGATGLNLVNQKFAILYSPIWTPADFDQYIYRSLRYSETPVDYKLSVYVLCCVRPENSLSKADTTDVHIWNMCEESRMIINEFMDAIKPVTIDCSIQHLRPELTELPNCRICCKSTQPLYNRSYDIHADLKMDLASPDPCKPKETVSADEIEIDKKKYYVVSDPIAFYGFRVFVNNEKQNTYLEIFDKEIYGKINEKISGSI